MGGIFLNYRKGAHTGVVEALHDRLGRHFGHERVFLDMPSIQPGERYADVLSARVVGCDVLLAIIHAGWQDERDVDGRPLLHRPGDWVRREIELALRTGRTVIPVLLSDVRTPPAAELPASIRELSMRQGSRIRRGSFTADVDALIRRLEQFVSPWSPPPPPVAEPARPPGRRRLTMLAAVAGCLLVVPPVLLTTRGDPAYPAAATPPWTITLALWSVLMMAAWLVAVGVTGAIRARINAWEGELQPVPARLYNQRFAIPLSIAALTAAAVPAVTARRWEWSALLALAVVVLGVANMGLLAIRAETADAEDEANWPRLPAAPLQLTLRRAVARLDQRLATWPPPLTREQRDKVSWLLAGLARATAELREQADHSRGHWLRVRHPRGATGYALWMAATCGLFLAGIGAGSPSHPAARQVMAITGFLVILAAIAAGTLETMFRYERWRCRTVAAEVDRRSAELHRRLQAAATYPAAGALPPGAAPTDSAGPLSAPPTHAAPDLHDEAAAPTVTAKVSGRLTTTAGTTVTLTAIGALVVGILLWTRTESTPRSRPACGDIGVAHESIDDYRVNRQAWLDAYNAAGGREKLGCPVPVREQGLVHQWGRGMSQDLADDQNRQSRLMALDTDKVIVMTGTYWTDYTKPHNRVAAGLQGYPTSDPITCGNARVVPLDGGELTPAAMVSTPTGRFVWLPRPLWLHYLQLGGPQGPLGRPLNPLDQNIEGRIQFENGSTIELRDRHVVNPPGAKTVPATTASVPCPP